MPTTAKALGDFRHVEFSLAAQADPVTTVGHLAEEYRDFDIAKHNVVALLHAATARDPYDKELINVVGTLSTQSDEFRSLWADHDVFRYRSGAKLLTHSMVGDLEFGYESFELSTDPGLVMLVYTVEPGSPTAEAMSILASWTAPATQAPQHQPPKP